MFDLVAVLIRLVRTFLWDVDVGRLLVAEFGQVHVQLLEVQLRDLLVEMLRQDVDLVVVVAVVLPQFDITKLGWPVALPRLSRRPCDSSRMR